MSTDDPRFNPGYKLSMPIDDRVPRRRNMDIEVPKPAMTDYGRAQFATEYAFSSLLRQAGDTGLKVEPLMGLMYLPTQEMAEAFIQACRTILLALTPVASHVKGSDGKEYWLGDGNVPG